MRREAVALSRHWFGTRESGEEREELSWSMIFDIIFGSVATLAAIPVWIFFGFAQCTLWWIIPLHFLVSLLLTVLTLPALGYLNYTLLAWATRRIARLDFETINDIRREIDEVNKGQMYVGIFLTMLIGTILYYVLGGS